ncbi:glycosyltransferase [Metabacillus indicus]|uniref:glycosyltransferase n=1 Tax=Metabacillus indicus TaxID=246786 RepID=UPI00068F5C49|nr:glycosyltransferase [Metabacillus indicus]
MKIALFIPVLGFGGAEKVMITLANGLAQRGHSIDLILVQKKGELLQEVSSDVNVIDLKSKKTFFSLVPLIRYLRRQKPEFLISALDNANIISSLAMTFSFSKTRHIPTLHTNLMRSYKKTRKFVQKINPFLLKAAFRRANKIVAVSKGTAAASAQFLGIPETKIEVIYNPVLDPSIKKKAEVNLNHPWLADRKVPVVLAVGRLFEAKDYPTLLKGFAAVLKHTPAKLIIAGDGKESIRKELKDLAKELQIDSEVDFIGFSENPYSYIKHADVFVLASKWEGFGNVLAEALYLGTAVVSSDCESGPREILKNGDFGLLFPVGDADKLSEALLQQLSEPMKIDKEHLEHHLLAMSKDFSVDHYEKVLKRESGEKSHESFSDYPHS